MSDQGQWAALLAHRAAALAKPAQQSERNPGTDVVIVAVAGRRYAVESRYVRQVARSGTLARLPGGTGELIGLAIRHGETVPVADLGSVLGLSTIGQTRPFTVTLGVDEPPVGVLVDALLAAGPMPLECRWSPHTEVGEEAPLEVGLLPDGVVILDGRALLDDERFQVRQKNTNPAPHAGAVRDGGGR